MGVRESVDSLRRGEFILLHDSQGREDEVDMVVAAQFVTPEHVARMRQHAGGLVCAAAEKQFADRLGIGYMHQLLGSALPPAMQPMVSGLAPYGDHPTFSLSVNHYRTYTGVTDKDRACTIRELASLYGVQEPQKKFVSSFRAPGHVPLLIASGGLLAERCGHTEMSVYLSKIAGLSPVTAICEMMDAQTYSALSVHKAKQYASNNAIPFLDGQHLLEYSKVN